MHKEYGTYVDVYILTFGGLRGRGRVGLRGVRRRGRGGRVHAAVRRLGPAARACPCLADQYSHFKSLHQHNIETLTYFFHYVASCIVIHKITVSKVFGNIPLIGNFIFFGH